jgi:hypothetical protein
MGLSPVERKVLRYATDYAPADAVRWPQHFFGKRRARAWRLARSRLVRLGLLVKAGGYYYETRRGAMRRMGGTGARAVAFSGGGSFGAYHDRHLGPELRGAI